MIATGVRFPHGPPMFDKKKPLYWVKLIITGPDRRGMWEELLWLLKHQSIRCNLNIHHYTWWHDAYYDIDWGCEQCGKPGYPWRSRFSIWASTHTMNPLAWPWVLYMSLRYKFWEWVANRAQKD